MIFVTVGTQEPFDRLIKIVDKWAKGKNIEVFAQIAESVYIPKIIKYKSFINQDEYENILSGTKLIVSHAGMGTILTALERGIPLIVFPRLAKLREHRNDHQWDTMLSISKLGYIDAIKSEEELLQKLNNQQTIQPKPKINNHASQSLINFITEYIANN